MQTFTGRMPLLKEFSSTVSSTYTSASLIGVVCFTANLTKSLLKELHKSAENVAKVLYRILPCGVTVCVPKLFSLFQFYNP